MNISNETSNKIKEMLNHPDSQGLKNQIEKLDRNMIFQFIRQINPSETDIKMAEEKIKHMSQEELFDEIMKKLKG